MIVGKIIGKTTTNKFEFVIEYNINKFDYIQVYHKDYGYVLCQVMEIEKTNDNVIGKANVIGYKDSEKSKKTIRSPFDIGIEVLKAEEEFIKKIIIEQENKENCAFIGKLEGTDIDVYLDINKLLTKHVCVLAKSGSGKSYCVGVLLEEIIEKNIPLLIIDPHGEYSSLKKENDNKEEIEKLQKYNLKPKAFNKKIVEYGNLEIDNNLKPIKLNDNLTAQEVIDLLPTKLTSNQMGLLYSTIKNIENFTFESLIQNLEMSENNLKWNLINTIEYLQGFKIFSKNPTSYNEIIQPGKCSILNMKGIEPEVQQIIVYKLLKDLFSERKKGNIPPFFLVIEEAHNYVPEKGFSDAKSSKIIKTIASEGRKFGLGLCVVSQRPAIVQKTVLSQCTTQIILKITNPNDLKAVTSSVEGITQESEQEIKNLPIGTALVTGIAQTPLLTNIRSRKTKHGGEAIDILGNIENDKKFYEELNEFKEKELIPVIIPNLKKEDLKLMTGNLNVKTVLIPCILFSCKNKTIEFNLLVEMNTGGILRDIEEINLNPSFLPQLDKLNKNELKFLETAYSLKKFSIIDIIQKSGISFQANEDINSLIERGYITKIDDNQQLFEISKDYIFSNPAKYAFYGKIEFKNVYFDKKIEKKQRLDTIKSKLSKFTNILDQRECYLVHYENEK
ncbi:MAG: ATP-binding protein [Nanoarchaeota archaeon]